MPNENSWEYFKKPEKIPLTAQQSDRLTQELNPATARNPKRELELMDDIYRSSIRDRSPKQALQNFLGVTLGVSDVFTSIKRPNDLKWRFVRGAVNFNLTEMLAMDYSEQLPTKDFGLLRDQALLLKRDDDPFNSWFYDKVLTLSQSMTDWRLTFPWINLLAKRYGQFSPRVVAELKQQSDDLWPEVLKQRAYGLKTCFYDSPLFLPFGQAFYVFNDRLGGKNRMRTNTVGFIGFGKKPQTSDQITPQHAVVTNSVGEQLNVMSHDHTQNIFTITRDGEILSSVVADLPLRRAFEKKAGEAGFEAWRLFTYLRIFDLTGRARVVERMPSIEDLEKEVLRGSTNWLGMAGKIKEVKFDFPKLVVPRVKYLREKDSKTPEEDETTRTFRDKHTVEWFVRPLPSGYKASLESIRFAEENGVVLLEGETIVQGHERGKTKDESQQGASKKPLKAVFRKLK